MKFKDHKKSSAEQKQQNKVISIARIQANLLLVGR